MPGNLHPHPLPDTWLTAGRGPGPDIAVRYQLALQTHNSLVEADSAWRVDAPRQVSFQRLDVGSTMQWAMAPCSLSIPLCLRSEHPALSLWSMPTPVSPGLLKARL